MSAAKMKNGWKKAAPAGAGLAAVVGLTGAFTVLRRKRKPEAGETVDWIDGYSVEIETKLLEAAETLERRLDSIPELSPKERAKLNIALERARSRVSEASGNLLFKLGGPADSPSSDGAKSC
ncbi:MAG: hypothetical protein GF344_09650 [Chitinivibrionales bacterium]|nr:hypothetical protein [Chitinivibrionales bacterium]MBD3357106.1 hypothetical protein [Chitinivibrionales bacterium]